MRIIARDEFNREIVPILITGQSFRSSRDHEKLVNKMRNRDKWITDVQIVDMRRKNERSERAEFV